MNHMALGEYRPISLVRSLYKIITKLLARRIKVVLPSVIDSRQSAFLEGRHLIHSALAASQVVDEARRKMKRCVIFKVDYEKSL